MNRRETLKFIGISTLSAGWLLDACKPAKKEAPVHKQEPADRQPLETARDKQLQATTFFTPHEMATITVLADLIIPKDDRSGSASEAGVPAFIEFIVKDKPEHQLPMRGGLRWLDLQCLKQYNKAFVDCSAAQQIAIIDQIAFPQTAKPAMQQGVAFFDRMRELTAIGFFTSKTGIEDLGYVGNRPNKWEGVPHEIVQQYGLENVRFDSIHNYPPFKI